MGGGGEAPWRHVTNNQVSESLLPLMVSADTLAKRNEKKKKVCVGHDDILEYV